MVDRVQHHALDVMHADAP